MTLNYPSTLPDIKEHFAWILSYYRLPWNYIFQNTSPFNVIESWLNNIGYALNFFGKDTGFVDKHGVPVRVGDILGINPDPFTSESARNPVWFAGEGSVPHICLEIDLQPARNQVYFQYAPVLPTEFSLLIIIGDIVTCPEKFHLTPALTDKELVRLQLEKLKEPNKKAEYDAALVKERLINDPMCGTDPQYESL